MKLTATSLRNRQEGMGHVLMVILVVVVLAVIGLIGYKVAGGNKKASTTTTSTTASSETQAAVTGCEATYHDTNLCQAAAHASLDKVPYKATISSTDASGTASSMTLLSDGKGNTSISGTGSGAAFNSIQLNGANYVETSGVWYAYPAGDTSASAQSDPTTNMKLVLGAGITYKPLGKEACGSGTCFKYQVTDAAMPNATQLTWFDDSSYQLREWKYTDPSSGSVDMTIAYQSVNITKPSPVQQINTGQ